MTEETGTGRPQAGEIKALLGLLALAERLKCELRHSWLSDGRQESVAEHCYQMALMAMLIHRHLSMPVDLLRTLKIVLVHDLVEAEVGDVPFFETGTRKEMKAERERAAICRIRDRLGGAAGQELHTLWHEFEDLSSNEAKFAKALDNLEVQIQHNLADFSTWLPLEQELVFTKMDRHCAVDPFLGALCDAVKAAGEAKMRAAGVDTHALKARLGVTEH